MSEFESCRVQVVVQDGLDVKIAYDIGDILILSPGWLMIKSFIEKRSNATRLVFPN